jgi:hypothetical protein
VLSEVIHMLSQHLYFERGFYKISLDVDPHNQHIIRIAYKWESCDRRAQTVIPMLLNSTGVCNIKLVGHPFRLTAKTLDCP